MITDNEYTVIFDKNSATIKRKDGSTALTATKRNQFYVVSKMKNHAMAVHKINEDNLTHWRQRYGHLNIADLKNLKIREMVKVIENLQQKLMSFDEICNQSKLYTKPFKPLQNRETEVLSLIHSDICGPMNVESLERSRYFVTFIDDFSRYTETVILRKRSGVLKAFRNYKRRVENQTVQRIKNNKHGYKKGN